MHSEKNIFVVITIGFARQPPRMVVHVSTVTSVHGLVSSAVPPVPRFFGGVMIHCRKTPAIAGVLFVVGRGGDPANAGGAGARGAGGG